MGKIGYYSAASAVMAYQMAIDITGNNLANVNTNGFKASRPSFADLIYTERNNRNEETQFGHGTYIPKTDMMFEQSQLRSTGRELDYCCLDEGFFAIEAPEDGVITYTKDGAFYITQDPDVEGGWLLCNEYGGWVLDYEGNRISIPFDEYGDMDSGAITPQIGVYTFENPYGLDQYGDNYYMPNASSGPAIANEMAGKKQRWLEASSTNIANEMSKVIEYQRAFQLNINMVKTHDEMQNVVNNLRN